MKKRKNCEGGIIESSRVETLKKSRNTDIVPNGLPILSSYFEIPRLPRMIVVWIKRPAIWSNAGELEKVLIKWEKYDTTVLKYLRESLDPIFPLDLSALVLSYLVISRPNIIKDNHETLILSKVEKEIACLDKTKPLSTLYLLCFQLWAFGPYPSTAVLFWRLVKRFLVVYSFPEQLVIAIGLVFTAPCARKNEFDLFLLWNVVYYAKMNGKIPDHTQILLTLPRQSSNWCLDLVYYFHGNGEAILGHQPVLRESHPHVFHEIVETFQLVLQYWDEVLNRKNRVYGHRENTFCKVDAMCAWASV